MRRPLLSVITVVYNGAATLEATISSVAGQTFTDKEFVVVDGGSSDGTLDLLDKYKDTIGTMVSEPDKGVYDAMNKGIGLAKGEWLYFLGSDDRFHDENVLTSLFAGQANTDCHLLYGNVISPSYKGPYDGAFTLQKLLSRNISHQAAFYRRELFDQLGNFNLRYRMHADWDFNLRCFMAPFVQAKWKNIIVAEFGAEGISSRPDIPFLRERLIPEKLHALNKEGLRPLRRLSAYDEWWRFLRNAGIRDEKDLQPASEPVPAPIRSMIRWQRKVPAPMLLKGLFSKSWMFVSYLFQRLTGSLDGA